VRVSDLNLEDWYRVTNPDKPGEQHICSYVGYVIPKGSIDFQYYFRVGPNKNPRLIRISEDNLTNFVKQVV
jgi:hypothetical protein